MERRDFLKAAGVATLAIPAMLRARPGTRPKVIVIGAGIIGAGIAYELAKRGAEVTVLERAAPAAGTTGDSYAYLNASTKSGSRPYFDLNWLGMQGWRVWQREAGAALPLRWDGAVYWRDGAAESAKLDTALATVRGWGYAGERIDADDVHRLLPTVTGGPVSTAGYFPEEGSVDPAAAVAALLARAKALDARVIYPVTVSSLILAGGIARGVRTDRGEMLADTVVLAAGIGSRALAEAHGIKLPLGASAGILLRTQPHAPIVDRLAFAPGATFRQMTDGRLLASIGHEGASVAAGSTSAQMALDIAKATAVYLPQMRGIAVERVSVGQRVLPADTFPIAGHAPGVKGLYIVATHSGVTLAPVLGRFAATEILDDVRIDALGSFRLDRFK